MKVDVYSVMHNEEIIAPYWLRHYETFADRIFIWDDDSTDSTREILAASPKVTFLPVEKYGDDDDYWITSLFPQYEKISRGVADWVMIADADEFIYHPNMIEALSKAKEQGSQIIGCQGFTMVSDGLPTTSGQIYDEIKMGLPDQLESKWTIHVPNIFVRYGRGRHVKPHRKMGNVLDSETGIKLLHYRYLGPEFYESRDMRNQIRNALAYGYEAEYIPDKRRRLPDRTDGSGIEWHQINKSRAKNVVDGDWQET